MFDFTASNSLKKSLSKLSISKNKWFLYFFKFNLNILSKEIDKISVMCVIDNMSSDINVGNNLDKNI